MAKWLLVMNPMSAGGRTSRRLPAVLDALKTVTDFEISVRETKAQGHATEIVQEAITEDWDGILSMGGDGTHNEVLNGFFDENGALLRENLALGILPAGSGGDFARMIYPTRDPIKAVKNLRNHKIQNIDVGHCRLLSEKKSRCFLNLASLGMSAEVVRNANRGRKLFGGRITYHLGVLKTALSYKQHPIQLKVDQNTVQSDKTRMIAIANGRFAGGGMMLAPNSSFQDGLLDVVIVGEMSGLATLFHSTKLYKGKHLALKQVDVFQGVDIHAEQTAPDQGTVYVELDGEEVGQLPARFEILPRCLPFLMPLPPSNDD